MEVEAGAAELAHRRDVGRGVHPAGEGGAHWDVAAQVEAHAVEEELVQSLGRLVERELADRVRLGAPVLLIGGPLRGSERDLHVVPRLDLPDGREHRVPAVVGTAEAEIVEDALQVRVPARAR
jgi:hypothetical protein